MQVALVVDCLVLIGTVLMLQQVLRNGTRKVPIRITAERRRKKTGR